MSTAQEQNQTWLEVALNGPWGKSRHPELPVSVGEIIADGVACVEAGAAILHVHAYDVETDRQSDDWQLYAKIIEGIKAKVDAIVYPTIPIPGAGADLDDADGEIRFAPTHELAKRGLLEWSAIDPGSVNLTYLDNISRQKPGLLYQNPDAHIQTAMGQAASFNFHPSYAIYEPGFLRAGAAYARAYPDAPTAIYRFMFTEGYSFGFPPRSYALRSYLLLLAEMKVTAPWMIAGLQVGIEPLIEEAVRFGGHIRVGLEDAERNDSRNNLQWTTLARQQIEAADGQLATAEEVRQALTENY